MDWLNVLSNGCIFFTVVMFSTGIPQCLQMFRLKSTKNVPFLPYLMTNVNNNAWIIYGQMTHNSTVVLVNIIGAVLQTLYMVVHIIYSDRKMKEAVHSLMAAMCLFSGWIFVTYAMDSLSAAINLTGVICCVITILMFASPLAEINTVITTQSTTTISFPLTMASFICAGLWTLFGTMLHDSFIVVPNLLGVLTSLLRFYLFYKFHFKSELLPV